LRVALAYQLLKSSRLGVERIAERTGFASSRQLRRAWRRSYDMPPIALRNSSASNLAELTEPHPAI
ncbi:MAG TPA: helix-turn-helix domain-containing protein, partial [Steroidobacteraceae bacterium]